MLNTSHFRHQTTGTKIKCIDRVYIKDIDRRIRDRMDKMTMNRPLVYRSLESTLIVINIIQVQSHNNMQRYYPENLSVKEATQKTFFP